VTQRSIVRYQRTELPRPDQARRSALAGRGTYRAWPSTQSQSVNPRPPPIAAMPNAPLRASRAGIVMGCFRTLKVVV
jgi:hypothetical protein